MADRVGYSKRGGLVSEAYVQKDKGYCQVCGREYDNNDLVSVVDELLGIKKVCRKCFSKLKNND
jgi:hypothetical protein